MSNTYGIGNALVDIIAAPSKALDEVRDRVRWLWVPMGIVIVLSIASMVTYYAWVDFDWLVDQAVAQALQGGADPSAEAGIRGFMQPGTMMAVTVVSILAMTLLIYVLQAAYLHLVNKVAGNPALRFGQWFALSAWSGFPMVFQALATFVLIAMTANRQLGQHELSPLSLQSLVIRADAGSSWAAWGSSITLITFWTIGLLGLGIMRWTGASALKAIVIAAMPSVLIFGIWALVIA
ncbi:MAG: YIP1 family protein [Wenzhouxiangellaceae bacterium]